MGFLDVFVAFTFLPGNKGFLNLIGGGGDGRIYLAGDTAVGLSLNEFLAGVTDDNRDVETSPVWEDKMAAITTEMESEAVRDLPVME